MTTENERYMAALETFKKLTNTTEVELIETINGRYNDEDIYDIWDENLSNYMNAFTEIIGLLGNTSTKKNVAEALVVCHDLELELEESDAYHIEEYDNAWNWMWDAAGSELYSALEDIIDGVQCRVRTNPELFI